MNNTQYDIPPVYEDAVNTKSLTKHFGSFAAVEDVSFYVPKGEIFGLLGPNGAGKTTTIRMLCGIMRPSSGSGTVLGFDIVKQSEEIKKNIGYMSQKFSLYNDLSAVENISFYAAVYGVKRDQRKSRIEEMIERAGLVGYEKALTKNLSGAWRQRLALACAIVHKPPMLFLDEATAGVDPISRREFWDLIYEMAGEGVSVLATTHYMDEADYCNAIGMMYRGKLIKVASPDTFRDQYPGHLVMIECDDPLRAEKILDAQDSVLDASVHGVQIHVTLQSTRYLGQIERILKKENIHVSRAEDIQPSLEDVFIEMIEQQRHLIEGI